MRTVCEPIFARPISEISFGQLVLRLFQVARRFDMPVQPQLVLLQKTLLNIEGLGRQLYPELDLWETAKPYLERWMRDQVGPSALLKTLSRELPSVMPLIPELPGLVHEWLRRQRDGDALQPDGGDDRIARLEAQLKRAGQQKNRVVFGSVLLMGSIATTLAVNTLALGVLGEAAATLLSVAGAASCSGNLFEILSLR